MTTLAHRSSWLTSALYHADRNATRCGYLTLFLRDGTALLYSSIPSYIPGLIAAHRSLGRAYNLLVKSGRYPYQRLDCKQAAELKEIIR